MLESLSLVATVAAASCISLIIGVRAYSKLRPKFPVRVNCWFCNENSDVPYDTRNSWECPYCEQYNGFTVEGGYNKVIPAQHDELFNYGVSGCSFATKTSPAFAKSPLCRKCNINQELKIQQLASFTPREPSCFDEEVEEYRQHLERAYQLCNTCEEAVKQTLFKQQGWLLDQRRKFLQADYLQNVTALKKWWQQGIPLAWLQTCHFVAMVVAFSQFLTHGSKLIKSFENFMSPDIQYFLEMTSSYEHITTCLVTSTLIIVTSFSQCRGRIDVASVVLWIVVLCHSWLVIWPNWRNKFVENDLQTAHVIVLLLTLIVNSLAAVVPRQQYLQKRLDLHKTQTVRKRPEGGRNIRNIAERFNSSEGSFADEQSFSNKSSSIASSPGNSSHTGVFFANVSPPMTPTTPNSVFQSSNSDSRYNRDVESTLEWEFAKLNLGTSCNDSGNKRSVTHFGTNHYYNKNGMNLFHVSNINMEERNHLRYRQNSLLQPAKLNVRRSITQSSWVAGGYWQEIGSTLNRRMVGCKTGMETNMPSATYTPISRSSSCSSGFHSHSSQSPASLANSYNGSLCGGDTDRISTLSEPMSQQGASDQLSFPNAKPICVGVPYYAGFPWCMPHVCAMGISATPHNPSLLYNPQCFVNQKQLLYGPPHNQPMFPLTPMKPTFFPISDAHSQSNSCPGLNSRVPVAETLKWNFSSVCCVIKRNVTFSTLFIGSVLINIFGIGFILYKNSFVIST